MDDGGQFLTHMWRSVSNLVGFSLILLLLIFLWTIVDIVKRGVRYCAAMWQSRSFREGSAGLLERGEWESSLAMAEALNRSHVAMVYLGALQEFGRARECASAEQAVEAASRGARIARNRVHEQLRQGLNSLSAIATTAPLVGLFGTAIGILDSFRGYVGSRSGYIAFIATNLADALVPTAAGLLIAVVAMGWFNWRSDRLAVFDAEMEIASLELEKYLNQQRRAGKL